MLHKSVLNVMEEKEVWLKSCLGVRQLCEHWCHGDFLGEIGDWELQGGLG